MTSVAAPHEGDALRKAEVPRDFGPVSYRLWYTDLPVTSFRGVLRLAATVATTAVLAYAQAPPPTTNPWVATINKIRDMFTGDLAAACSVIAVCIGGIMFAFGEGAHKRTIALLILGVGMALSAVQVVEWMRA